MKSFDESELRKLLNAYEVCEPDIMLVERTKRRIHEELAQVPDPVPVWQRRWVLVIFVSAVLFTLNLFYMLSIGTILYYFIPPQFIVYLSRSLYAFTAAETCLIAGTLMVLFFRQLQHSHLRVANVGHNGFSEHREF